MAPPKGFIPAQEPDPITGHFPGWILCDENNPSDRYHIEAFNREKEEIKRINDNKEFFIEFYRNNKQRFVNNNLLAKKLTHDTADKDFLKKLTGLYEYEFQTGDRRVNVDFEDDFFFFFLYDL